MDYSNMVVRKAAQSVGGLKGAENQATSISACERQPQIEVQMICLEARASDIREQINNLEKRLTAILRPATPREGQNGIEPGVTAPLADAISNINASLQYSVISLSEILDRVEL